MDAELTAAQNRRLGRQRGRRRVNNRLRLGGSNPDEK
jgi:hypothetical protein